MLLVLDLMKWLKKALGKSGRKVAAELVTKGYIAAREGRLESAQKLYHEAIDADDTLAVAYFNAGQTELELCKRDYAALNDAARVQRLSSAALYLSQGLERDPTHAQSSRTLARVRERQQAFVAAVAAWTRTRESLAAAQPPADPADLEEARREASRLQPFADLEAALSTARASLSSPHLDSVATALANLQETTERGAAAGIDEPPRLFTLLGALARKLGQLDQARAFFETASARDKHDLEALRELATLCRAAGDMKTSLSTSMAAYRLDPLDAGLVCNVGVCHLALGDLAQAREFIVLAAAMAPEDPIVIRAAAALNLAD